MPVAPSTLPSTSAIPVDLRCERSVNPLGVDAAQPRLSWRLQPLCPDARGLVQRAYRVLASRSAEALARDEGDL